MPPWQQTSSRNKTIQTDRQSDRRACLLPFELRRPKMIKSSCESSLMVVVVHSVFDVSAAFSCLTVIRGKERKGKRQRQRQKAPTRHKSEIEKLVKTEVGCTHSPFTFFPQQPADFPGCTPVAGTLLPLSFFCCPFLANFVLESLSPLPRLHPNTHAHTQAKLIEAKVARSLALLR